MQAGAAEHLRQLIETSPILTPAERADWLDMLILMNDKQASELEDILKAPRPTAAPIPRPQAIPPLTHISNLPSDLNAPAPARPASPSPRPSPAPPASLPVMPWQKQFEATMSEKELPAPLVKNPVPRPSVPTRSSPPPKEAAPVPAMRPQSTPAGAPISLETLTDTAQLSVGALRHMDPADLQIRLQQLTKMEGYFNVLSYLEDSPLYKSYLETGKKVLAGQLSFAQPGRQDPALMNKEEFESFADILRKIQIN